MYLSMMVFEGAIEGGLFGTSPGFHQIPRGCLIRTAYQTWTTWAGSESIPVLTDTMLVVNPLLTSVQVTIHHGEERYWRVVFDL